MATKKSPRNLALIIAFDANGNVELELELPIDDYYDEGVEVLDSSAARVKGGVRIIKGELYTHKGFSERFENHYDTRGKLILTRSVFDDGTSNEQVF
jgi:hypothetical protein